MSTQTSNSTVYEQLMQNMRQAAETGLKMQQDVFQQWTHLWPGLPTSQSAWMDKFRDFHRRWVDTVSELAHKHRDVMDRQYQAAVDSLEEALRVTEASSPEDFRRRAELVCRKTLDCMREISETQMNEFQSAMTKWSELLTKANS